MVEKVLNINIGIGVDGMILICLFDVVLVKMCMFNNDGLEGKSCGNGLCCVVKYVYEYKLVEEIVFIIEMLVGIVMVEVIVEDGVVILVKIDMGVFCLICVEILMFGESEILFICENFLYNNYCYVFIVVLMGNLYVVIFVDDVEKVFFIIFGLVFEIYEMFLEWVNVEFIEILNEDEMNFCVWECGFGVI